MQTSLAPPAAPRRGGRCLRRAAASRPAARRSRPACRNASTSSGLVSKPTLNAPRFRNVRTNSSAPTSATSANAICATTSVLRRNDFATVLPRVPSFSVSCRLPREICSAGNSPKTIAGSGGDGDRVDDRTPIDFPVDVVRHLIGRNAGSNESRADDGEQDSERDAQQPEDQTLGEQLPDDSSAAGAKCGTHRYLAASAGGACQQKIGDVRAGDEQDEGHAGHHQHEYQRHFRAEETPPAAFAAATPSPRSCRDTATRGAPQWRRAPDAPAPS